MPSSNAILVQQYLHAIESMRSAEDVFEFFAADVVMREFPNRIAPKGEVGVKTIYRLSTNERVRSRDRRAYKGPEHRRIR